MRSFETWFHAARTDCDIAELSNQRLLQHKRFSISEEGCLSLAMLLEFEGICGISPVSCGVQKGVTAQKMQLFQPRIFSFIDNNEIGTFCTLKIAKTFRKGSFLDHFGLFSQVWISKRPICSKTARWNISFLIAVVLPNPWEVQEVSGVRGTFFLTLTYWGQLAV